MPLPSLATECSNPMRSFAARIIASFVSRDLARRDLALDAFRGLMILGMILVNHPPPTADLYPPLMHAAWNGWTMADTIFPGFLFTVGVSIRLSMVDGSGRPNPPDGAVLGKVLRRFALLQVLNLLLINFPYYFGVQLRFSGTLALIAWSYLFAVCAHLWTGWRWHLALLCILIALQWAILSLLPMPGSNAGTMTPEANAARYLDQILFAPVLGPAWTVDGDEVIALPAFGLPALGALASTLTGLLAGNWMSVRRPLTERLSGLFAAGLALLALGTAWNPLLPINKTLWTGSYVLFMAGLSLQMYAFGVWLIHHCGVRVWAVPLQVAGANALFFYVLAQGIQRLLVYGRIHTGDGSTVRLKQVVYEAFLSTSLDGPFGALVYAIIFLLLCYLVVLIFFRRRIFLKL
jgi:predicted acyltransferase